MCKAEERQSFWFLSDNVRSTSHERLALACWALRKNSQRQLQAGGRLRFLSATCEASSHEGKNACQPKRLAHVSFPECKGTMFLPFTKSLMFGIYIPNIRYLTWNIAILKFISLRNPSVSRLSWSRKINLRIHVIFSIYFSFKRRAAKLQSVFRNTENTEVHGFSRFSSEILSSEKTFSQKPYTPTSAPYIFV